MKALQYRTIGQPPDVVEIDKPESAYERLASDDIHGRAVIVP